MTWKPYINQLLPLKDKLYRLALRVVGTEAEAEDVVQEVFMKMWKKRDEAATILNKEAWIVQMTKNLAIDKSRSKHRRTLSINKDFDLVGIQPQPDRVAEVQDTVSRVHQLIATLPEKQKMVIQLRDIEGHSYQEISEMLDMPMNSVKATLFRARQFLKTQIEKANDYGL
ncbi:MAG: RNA polymerase sigma factor (sigma-70 family) [Polaribacter sp.]|jgi:RNA polymerase sigma factor (sigma-70 family)